MNNECIGDTADDISEKSLILCEAWDDETHETVREYVLQNMHRKVRLSVWDGHLKAGGQYLSIKEYAEAMTDRIMNKRERLAGLKGDVRMRHYYQIDGQAAAREMSQKGDVR